MADSTVFAFEQALLANLQARPGLSGVIVTDGPPTVGELVTGEWIMLGNARGGQTWKTFPVSAPTSRDETYTIDMLINVVQAVNAAQTALTKRAFVLLKEVEDELRGNPSQGVANVAWGEVASTIDVQKAMNPTAGWRETLLRVGIRVRARI